MIQEWSDHLDALRGRDKKRVQTRIKDVERQDAKADERSEAVLLDDQGAIDEASTSGPEARQSDVPVTDEQRNELNRRLRAYALDGNPGRPASEVVANLRRRIGRLK
jgi:hypothetical protein